MRGSAILHKYQPFMRMYLIINKRYNSCSISLFWNKASFFLLKHTESFYYIMKITLKHSSFSSLNLLNNVSKVPFFTSTSCHIILDMSITICSGLIWLKYLIPLLYCSSHMFSSPCQTFDSISFWNRRFPTCNSTMETSILKSSSYNMITDSQIHQKRNIDPWNTSISFL